MFLHMSTQKRGSKVLKFDQCPSDLGTSMHFGRALTKLQRCSWAEINGGCLDAFLVRSDNGMILVVEPDSGGMGQNLGPSKLPTHQHPVHLNKYIYIYTYHVCTHTCIYNYIYMYNH